MAEIARAMVSNGKAGGSETLFPATTAAIRALAWDQWAVTAIEDELVDYGTGLWQGRSVKALFVRITTERENAVLGVYGRDCLVLGYLIDEEFRLARDPTELDCSEADALAEWKKGHGFESLWHLEAN